MRTILRIFFVLIVAILGERCNSAKPIKSAQDLKEAFKIESTSAQKFNKYAQKALSEGYDTLAQLFKAASKSQNVQALNEERILKKFGESAEMAPPDNFEIKTTNENLQNSIKEETNLVQTVYSRFIREAENEKIPLAAKSFVWDCETQKKFIKYFRQAETIINEGNETNLPFTWLVCPTCGNTYNSTDVKGKCDFCLTRQEDFYRYTGAAPEGVESKSAN